MGASTLQHCNESSSSAHSVQQHRKDRNVPRMYTTGLFRPKDYYAEVITINWLCFSPSKRSIYCFTCRVMCMNTEKSKSSLLFTTGFCDWKQSHEQSTEHLKATISLNRRFKAMERIDTGLMKQAEDSEQYWISVLKRADSVTKFIVERDFAFRGDNKSFGSPRNGNFLGILE